LQAAILAVQQGEVLEMGVGIVQQDVDDDLVQQVHARDGR